MSVVLLAYSVPKQAMRTAGLSAMQLLRHKAGSSLNHAQKLRRIDIAVPLSQT